MSKIGIIAKLTTQPGKRDDLVAAFKDYLPNVEAEEGTLVYAISTDSGDENVVWVYELYPDQDAVAAHSGSEAFAEFGKSLGGVLAGAPEIFMHTPVAAKGVDV